MTGPTLAAKALRVAQGLRRKYWRRRAAWARRRHGSARSQESPWLNITSARPSRDGHGSHAWLAETAWAHRQRRASQPPPSGAEVTVVCVTNRPEHLDNVLAGYNRQNHGAKRLLVVTNSASFNLEDVRARLGTIPDAATVDVDPDASLGTCLNVAIERCETRYMAKVDDDDRYGAEYLSDMLTTHQLADAVVVGKHSYFAHLICRNLYVLRFPGRERFYTSTVAGGTLVIDLERLPAKVRFPERTVGEDVGFLDACHRARGSVFAADRFNYLQRRGSTNTWSIPIEQFLAHSLIVEPTTPAGIIEI